MPSVLVTGASRGLGYAFVTYFASLPDTTVIGLVRDKEATETRLARDGIKNITVLKADVTNPAELKQAADDTAKTTGGSLDLLINNAALISRKSAWKTLVDIPLPELVEDLTASFQANVVGVANTINSFLPLIRKGTMKKVITISTGMADDSLVNRFSLAIAGPYSISKAATNTLVAKYNAALGQSEGILFMAISPGVVDTSEGKPMSEEDIKGSQAMGAKFAEYAPHFAGPITPEESVKLVVDVIHSSTVEERGGQFLSHFVTSVIAPKRKGSFESTDCLPDGKVAKRAASRPLRKRNQDITGADDDEYVPYVESEEDGDDDKLDALDQDDLPCDLEDNQHELLNTDGSISIVTLGYESSAEDLKELEAQREKDIQADEVWTENAQRSRRRFIHISLRAVANSKMPGQAVVDMGDFAENKAGSKTIKIVECKYGNISKGPNGQYIEHGEEDVKTADESQGDVGECDCEIHQSRKEHARKVEYELAVLRGGRDK